MATDPNETKGSGTFEVPGWFRKLWNGTLFGRRKSKLILRILKLGGKDLLISECGLPLNMDMVGSTPAPSVKQLQAVLRKAEAEWKDTQTSMEKAASMLANSEDYNKEKKFVTYTGDTYCSMEVWTLKQPSTKLRKKRDEQQ
jgi:hypothetical protein